MPPVVGSSGHKYGAEKKAGRLGSLRESEPVA